MISLRLITTGLEDVHSVIGYEISDGVDTQQYLIKPREDSKFSYEAMHEINGISISEIKAKGLSRKESLRMLVNTITEELLVWYAPFINKFLLQVSKELDIAMTYSITDTYALAKHKGLASPSYKLADVYDYTGTDNLFDLYDYLDKLPEPKRIRRV